MNRQVLKIAVLAFPVVAMLCFILWHAQNRERGVLWHVPVSGYDPRDILRGHYLTFRYDWNFEKGAEQACRGDACALCLTARAADDDYNPKARILPVDDARQQCGSFVFGHTRADGAFEIGRKGGTGLRRYYIPESEAPVLDRLLRGQSQSGHKFDVALRVNDAGAAFVTGMRVNGTPLEDWVKSSRAGAAPKD